MALATPSWLRYKVEFNLDNDPKDLLFTDLIAGKYFSVYGFTLSNVKGLVKITGPDGVIYANAGYNNSDYTSPDISGTASIWSVAVELPVGDDGLVMPGTYRVDYKISVNGGTSTSYQAVYSYVFAYTDPVPVIAYVADNKYSTLTLYDNTDYEVGGVSPSNDLDVGRNWTVKYPPTVALVDVTGKTSPFVVGPNIWSGTYAVVLDVILAYDMELWDDAELKTVIYSNIIGQAAPEVTYDACACAFYNCLRLIEKRYQQELSDGDKVQADRIKTQMNLLTFYFMVYDMAMQCGYDTGWACGKIAEIAMYEGCNCDDDESPASREIIPWAAYSGTLAGSSNRWYDTVGPPSNSMGNNDDYSMDNLTGVVYKKVSGTWVAIITLKGDKGDSATGLHILFNQVADYATSAGTTEEDLISYLMDNTVPVMANNGDVLHVLASFSLGLNDNTKTIKMYFGGSIIATYFTDSKILSDSNTVEIEMYVVRLGASSQHIKYFIRRHGLPGDTIGPVITTGSVNLTTNITIKVTGQNGVAAASDIVAKEMRVTLLPNI